MADRVTATGWRRAQTRVLTVDTTVRKMTLSEGRYLLYGDAAAVVRFATRISDQAGAPVTGEAPEPVAADMAAATAGTAPAGVAWVSGGAGPPELPADATAYRFVDVAPGAHINLYLIADAAAHPKLVGPVTWDLVSGMPVG